jgi:hypothetical protein
VLVVLSPAAFGCTAYYFMAVAGMCFCQITNVVKARLVFDSTPSKQNALLQKM